MKPAFEYDPFQKKAIAHIEAGSSVIVSAPTGSGKTAIAEYVIDQCVQAHQGVIYTAPIKALSNQKYRDFCSKYGSDNVGIVTGDVAIHPYADILIMTTEIFRNALFEQAENSMQAQSEGRFERYSWVIFDEVHYIDDLERGTVWEESLMFFPDHMKMLCLSATIPNIESFVAWIEQIHQFPVDQVIEHERPVPLKHRFQCRGEVTGSLKRLQQLYHRCYRSQKRVPAKQLAQYTLDLVQHIQEQQQLPCIYFAFARRRCEELATQLSVHSFLNQEEKATLRQHVDELMQRFQLTQERSAKKFRPLLEQGIAYHHAGMLPSLKELVERLFATRLIKLLFTTETFALGVNMPAKTVVFDELRKFYGFQFENMHTRDYYQMAGRAGRRGLDQQGCVYSRVNPFRIGFEEVKRIVKGPPEEVRSQFNSSYATLMHLYKQFRSDLYDVYLSSLHYHQSNKKSRQLARAQLQAKIQVLMDLGYFYNNDLSLKGRFACQMHGYELVLGEMFEHGFLENLNSTTLCVVLGALIHEPRKGAFSPALDPEVRELKKQTKKITKKIFKCELLHGIFPPIKKSYFHLTPLIQAWSAGASFDKIQDMNLVDEGEMVRNMRMIIQLLRQMMSSGFMTPSWIQVAQEALYHLNRDAVDAERQLRC